MPDALRSDIQIFKLRGGDMAERNKQVAWKQLEESLERRDAGGPFSLGGRSVA